MRRHKRAKRDIAIILLSLLAVCGLVALGVDVANRFPQIYKDFASWKWRIFLGMALLPFTILIFACGAFALLGRLTRGGDGGPIS
jgi:hypothetical protein